MDQEQRIQAIEQRLAKSESGFREAVDLALFLGGSERVFQSALLAVLETHPNKAALRQLLETRTEQAQNAVLFDSQSEAHLQGAQDARTLILAALNKP